MTHASLRSAGAAPAPVPAALSAFLRGIERRAYVLALGQCADPALARAALGQTLRAFHSVCASTPLSSWPASFWALLLAQPELTQGHSGCPELRSLSSGPRAALLLRLVAGLDFGHAAQVLGVPEPAFRYASQRALQQLGEAGVSYAALAALRERLHRQIKTLSEEEIQALAALRDTALTEPVAPLPRPAARTAGLRPWLWVVLTVLVVAFAATWWPAPAPPLTPGQTQALPAAAPVDVRAAPGAADIVSHPDYPQLADPGAAALANDLALLSWLSADPKAFDATAQAQPPTEEVADAP